MFTRQIIIKSLRECSKINNISIAKSSQIGLSTKLLSKFIQFNHFHSTALNGAERVTLQQAKEMPKNYDEMPNDILLSMAVMGDQEAREERLIREIMSVDNVDWEGAQSRFLEMVEANRKGLFFATIPYKLGIFVSMSAGLGCIPMIFDLNTVLLFNEFFVTTDVPEERDLETMFEVGSFAWNWMEPPLGTISFSLLCFQFARAQLENLGAQPYTSKFKASRSDRLVKQYPQYNKFVVSSFSEGDPLTAPKINR
eukprot:gene12041-16114_t